MEDGSLANSLLPAVVGIVIERAGGAQCGGYSREFVGGCNRHAHLAAYGELAERQIYCDSSNN